MANLTAKELTALEDQLGVEQMLISKYHTMSQSITDPVLKQKCCDIANKHQQHFTTLMNYLN